jgi:hypothetical protein
MTERGEAQVSRYRAFAGICAAREVGVPVTGAGISADDAASLEEAGAGIVNA